MEYIILPLSDYSELAEEYEELEVIECRHITADSPEEAVEELREMLPGWDITPAGTKTALPLEYDVINRRTRAECGILIDID